VIALSTARPQVSRLTVAAAAVVCAVPVAAAVVMEGGRSPRNAVLFLLGAALAGAGFVSARLSIALTVATFFFWALLRRLLPAAEPSVDPAAIVPYLVAVPLAVRGLRVAKPVAVVALIGWATLTAVASFRPVIGLAGWLNFVLPLLVAFAVCSIPSGSAVLARWTVACGSLAAGYGIVQYFVPFRWDVEWLTRADFVSVGAFGKATFRPFATLPAPGTASVLVALVLLLLLFRRDLFDPSPPVRAWALAVSTLFLLLDQVRTAWIAFALAAVLGVLSRRGQSALRIAVCIAVAVVAMSLAPQASIVAKRAQTLTSLDSDASFRGRVAFLRGATQLVTPVGTGLGTRSSASRAEGDQSIDGGFLVVLAETGVVGLGLLIWVLAYAARHWRPFDRPFFGFLIVSSFAGYMFGGLSGVLLWSLCGVTAEVSPSGGRPFQPTGAKVPDDR